MSMKYYCDIIETIFTNISYWIISQITHICLYCIIVSYGNITKYYWAPLIISIMCNILYTKLWTPYMAIICHNMAIYGNWILNCHFHNGPTYMAIYGSIQMDGHYGTISIYGNTPLDRTMVVLLLNPKSKQ